MVIPVDLLLIRTFVVPDLGDMDLLHMLMVTTLHLRPRAPTRFPTIPRDPSKSRDRTITTLLITALMFSTRHREEGTKRKILM
jgi:hypothetical protein